MTRLGLSSLLVLLAVLGIGLLADPPEAAAQMYRWIDDQGETHFTLGIDSVPPRYRPKAVLMGEVAEPPGSRPAAPAAPAAPPQPGVPTGGARIRFTPGRPIVVEARINGGAFARLILDTGADGTVIKPSVLTALGISYRDARPGASQGVGGTVGTLMVRVDRIEVDQAKAGPLMVTSHDIGLGLFVDGLLGRDFLEKFEVNIDYGAGVLTLTPKQRR